MVRRSTRDHGCSQQVSPLQEESDWLLHPANHCILKIMKQRHAEQILYACLSESMGLKDIVKGFQPHFNDFQFLPLTHRDSSGTLRLFSGAFNAGRMTVLPFAVCFEGRMERAGMGSLACANSKAEADPAVYSFLSIIEYLRHTGAIKKPLAEYKEIVTRGGKYTRRQSAVDSFDKFRERVLKTTVPYDLSIELCENLYWEETEAEGQAAAAA